MAEASMTMTPARPQHMAALIRANEVRLARAELKRHVRAGTITVREVIERCPGEAVGMTLLVLLESQFRWGTYRCVKFLEQCHLSENKAVGALTDRQRGVLIDQLRERENGRLVAAH